MFGLKGPISYEQGSQLTKQKDVERGGWPTAPESSLVCEGEKRASDLKECLAKPNSRERNCQKE